MIAAVMMRFEGVVAQVEPSLCEWFDDFAGGAVDLDRACVDFYGAHEPFDAWFPDRLTDVGVAPGNVSAATARASQALARPLAWRAYGDVKEALDWMASRSIPVIVVSSFTVDLRAVLARVGISAPARFVGGMHTLSDVVWQETARLGVSADEILYVAASVETDFEDARSLGCYPLVIDRDDTFDENTPNINRLVEIELHI